MSVNIANSAVLCALPSLGDTSVFGEFVLLGVMPRGHHPGTLETQIGPRAVIRSHTVIHDVCQRLISWEGQVPAPIAGQAVERCVQLGALSCYDARRKMVQFRNFIVQRYEKVDAAISVDMVNRRLKDSERFRDEVVADVRG